MPIPSEPAVAGETTEESTPPTGSKTRRRDERAAFQHEREDERAGDQLARPAACRDKPSAYSAKKRRGISRKDREALAEAARSELPWLPISDGASASGCRVEVAMHEEGLIGSRYAATILELALAGGAVGVEGAAGAGTRRLTALVKFDEFFEEEEEEEVVVVAASRHLCEWVDAASLAPPPPPAQVGWWRKLRPGDVVEASHDGGWWQVKVLSREWLDKAAVFAVEAVGYHIRRTVATSCLRPVASA